MTDRPRREQTAVSVRLDEHALAWLDRCRGRMSRAEYCRRAIVDRIERDRERGWYDWFARKEDPCTT